MEITLKLHAMLSDYLPTHADRYSVQLDIPVGTTPHQVIDRFSIPHGQAHLVLLNGVYIDPADRDDPVIKEGDVLAVWPPIAGG